MRWRCCYVYHNGERCPAPAKWRLHFNLQDPFNYTDVCVLHSEEYQFFTSRQDLTEWQKDPIVNTSETLEEHIEKYVQQHTARSLPQAIKNILEKEKKDAK